jgi:hypothetical protein
MSVNRERDELLRKKREELIRLAERSLPPKLVPTKNSSKAVLVDAILKARRLTKIQPFFAPVPTSNKASTSTDSSGSPAKKKPKPTDEATTATTTAEATTATTSAEATTATNAAKTTTASKATIASEATTATTAAAEETTATEEEGFAYLVVELFSQDEESKTPSRDPSWLEANRRQIELLSKMKPLATKMQQHWTKYIPYHLCFPNAHNGSCGCLMT